MNATTPRMPRPASAPFHFHVTLFLLALLLLASTVVSAQTPPDPPVITEPEADGQIVNPSDVHMETQPMFDADGDDHLCTDFEIWTVDPSERVWITACIEGVERVHTHLGDGVFEGTHGDLSELLYDTDYQLRVRFRDSSGEWSAWSTRAFSTGDPTVVYAMELTDILPLPEPTLEDLDGEEFLFTGTAALRLEGADGAPFLRFEASSGDSNTVIDFASRPDHSPLRAVFEGGSAGIAIPDLDLRFTDDDGLDRIVYLPSTQVGIGAERTYWIAQSGASFVGSTAQTVPEFGELARGGAVPWRAVAKGFQTDIVATGFQLPVNIAFVPAPGPMAHDPYFYVTELYGAVRMVSRDFTVHDYATGLLNFDPTGNFPGSGEQGLAGIVVEPATGDLFVGLLYDSAPPNGPHYPRVVRMHSTDGGHSMSSMETVLDMPGETQGQSHFISNLSLGPDAKLYVHMGDGFNANTALDLDSFRGKVLRMELDGSPCVDNPFHDAGDGISARDYVWAYGLRNPFGGAWRASDGAHYSVENGPSVNDRFARITAGTSYGWDGSSASMLQGALYTWSPPHAPVNIAFVQAETFGGSRFPSTWLDRAFVTESGPTWATGAQARGKRIVAFQLDEFGGYVAGPTTVVEYDGVGKATAVGLAPGPDGLYFTDLYKDMDYASPIDAGANVLRVRWAGVADFLISSRVGEAPFAVHFTDVSTVPGAVAWKWNFGDGNSSSLHFPTHTYTEPGVYDVRLEVIGSAGLIVEQKNGAVFVGQGTQGLIAEYYDTRTLSGPALSRIDAAIDFAWQSGSPDPALGNDTFSARWTGILEIPTDDTWTLITRTDDGVRLWIDGVLRIDEWVNQSATDHEVQIPLTAGPHDLRMEYYENTGGAVARLSWESSTQARTVIPSSALSPELMVEPTPTPPGVRDSRVALLPNRPNPFNPRTEIAFAVPVDGVASVSVFDLRGRCVSMPWREREVGAGTHALLFEGRDREGRPLASGAYVYRLDFRPHHGGPVEVRSGRMILLK